MRIELDKQTFKQAIKQPVRLAKTKSSFAVLQNIELEGRDGKLIVTGTDLDVSVRIGVPAFVAEDGHAVVDAATLDKATNAPADTVAIITDKDSVTVTVGQVKHTLPKADATEYPSIAFAEGECDCEIDGAQLGCLCRKVAYAISKDEFRKEFTGALFTVQNGEAQMVSTDGHRLAKAECKATGKLEGCIVPSKAIQVLAGLTGTIKLHAAGGKLHVTAAGGVQMSISLIAGSFPDFSKVFPRSYNATATIDAKPLKDMLRSVGLATEKCGIVRMTIGNAQATLSASSNKLSACADIPCESEGEIVTIGINGEYLSQTIEAIGEERITLSIIDADSPMLVTGVAESESNEHIVMPMQI